MPTIRPYRPDDRAAVADVCLRTADAGADATGILPDDDLWALIFALPYVDRHPDLAWVVESDAGEVSGYIVATDDTEAFERWFRDEWWPPHAARFPRRAQEGSRADALVRYASRRGDDAGRRHEGYPAHLHIDLLPQVQRRGCGRRMLETLFAELTRRGVAGLHLGMDPANAGARAFYERVGLTVLAATPDELTFGIRFGGNSGPTDPRGKS